MPADNPIYANDLLQKELISSFAMFRHLCFLETVVVLLSVYIALTFNIEVSSESRNQDFSIDFYTVHAENSSANRA